MLLFSLIVLLSSLPPAYDTFKNTKARTPFKFNVFIYIHHQTSQWTYRLTPLLISLRHSSKFSLSYQGVLFLQLLCCSCSFYSAPPPLPASLADRHDRQFHVWDRLGVLIPTRTSSKGLCFYREFVQGKPYPNIHFTPGPIAITCSMSKGMEETFTVSKSLNYAWWNIIRDKCISIHKIHEVLIRNIP